ncbi:amidase [Streptomyces sp. MI02-7b]|uniref:amidase n=1 Tax=Streptomyces sp. MI02-7b TaxID=462941 RepID=UPI0029BAB27C|nr:amidase [Streptomyces sp. MI02-7b]MDX3075024.1 amidase [Streptomyces sp. MI02-7b]
MTDPVDRVAVVCDRIDRLDARVRAFVPEPDRRGRLAAEAAAAPPGVLSGVAVGVKDIVRCDGTQTRAGSRVPAEELAGPQAPLVDRLRAAGALIAGKTVTAEFAVTAPGPTRNPHNTAHTPGGSSSGSAAAVAAGMVPLAVGTQTVGSVIRPAAFCGVVGFKPTFGRIPVDGVIANAPSFDTVGVLAADVAGAALGASVLCDDWREPERGRGSEPEPGTARRPVLGVPAGPYLDRAGAEARAAFAAQTARLAAAGWTVREVPVMDGPGEFEAVVRQLFTMNRYEVARTHADWFPRHGRLYREQTVAAIREGQAIARDDYERAVRERRAVRARLLDAMERIDVWLAPSATGPAPFGLGSTGDSVMCLPWSNAGFPAVSLPAGYAANGLPLGLQVVGRPGEDEELLGWVAELAAVVMPR